MRGWHPNPKWTFPYPNAQREEGIEANELKRHTSHPESYHHRVTKTLYFLLLTSSKLPMVLRPPEAIGVRFLFFNSNGLRQEFKGEVTQGETEGLDRSDRVLLGEPVNKRPI
jgi:hypothetical protein